MNYLQQFFFIACYCHMYLIPVQILMKILNTLCPYVTHDTVDTESRGPHFPVF
jgi:hypothetical protein